MIAWRDDTNRSGCWLFGYERGVSGVDMVKVGMASLCAVDPDACCPTEIKPASEWIATSFQGSFCRDEKLEPGKVCDQAALPIMYRGSYLVLGDAG
jgi:hypothetical protein